MGTLLVQTVTGPGKTFEIFSVNRFKYLNHETSGGNKVYRFLFLSNAVSGWAGLALAHMGL